MRVCVCACACLCVRARVRVWLKLGTADDELGGTVAVYALFECLAVVLLEQAAVSASRAHRQQCELQRPQGIGTVCASHCGLGWLALPCMA